MEYIPIKRLREEEHHETIIINMANYFMLLSKGHMSHYKPYDSTSPSRVFECKTCKRQFPSFQALGGHRASHKKPRLNSDGDSTHGAPIKPKSHECSICGLEFAIGQALGGHMRRHRVITTNEDQSSTLTNLSNSVVKKVNSGRVFSLDLNLTPLENDLEFRKLVATTVELFI